jgi:ATP-binding cassette subfamily B protein
VQGTLSGLAGYGAQIYYSLSLFDPYLDILTAEPDLPVVAEAPALPPLRREIEFRDVWFRYAEDKPWVLRGVDLRISYGKSVAVVGLNGSGKSTLVKLLCRFYDPGKGAILWDGADIRSVDPADLRRHVSAVFQSWMEYDMTARENVGVGDIATLEDLPTIRVAAGEARIDDSLAHLPDGYDTFLSRDFLVHGDDETEKMPRTSLSGGQWQRIALARAFLRRHCDLMIFDEPSSGIDAEAEQGIHASVLTHHAGVTSVLVSHRLSAVRDADLIVVLSEGRVSEQGTHADLMDLNGSYAKLFRLQARGYAD